MKTRKIMAAALAIAMAFSLCSFSASADSSQLPKVTAMQQTIVIDGKTVEAEAYNIDGDNYFKLRDIAYLLSGTDARFSVETDPENRIVYTERTHEYISNGSELQTGRDKSGTCIKSEWSLYVDGGAAQMIDIYNIGGNNFFRLRDLAVLYGFGVSCDESSHRADIDSTAGYSLNFDNEAYETGSVSVTARMSSIRSTRSFTYLSPTLLPSR